MGLSSSLIVPLCQSEAGARALWSPARGLEGEGPPEWSALDVSPPGLSWSGTLHVWRASSLRRRAAGQQSWSSAHPVSPRAREMGQPLSPPLLTADPEGNGDRDTDKRLGAAPASPRPAPHLLPPARNPCGPQLAARSGTLRAWDRSAGLPTRSAGPGVVPPEMKWVNAQPLRTYKLSLSRFVTKKALPMKWKQCRGSSPPTGIQFVGKPDRRALPPPPKLSETTARTPGRSDARTQVPHPPLAPRPPGCHQGRGRCGGAGRAGARAPGGAPRPRGEAGRSYLLNAPIDVQVDGLGPVAGGAGAHLAPAAALGLFTVLSRRQRRGEGGSGREEGAGGGGRGDQPTRARPRARPLRRRLRRLARPGSRSAPRPPPPSCRLPPASCLLPPPSFPLLLSSSSSSLRLPSRSPPLPPPPSLSPPPRSPSAASSPFSLSPSSSPLCALPLLLSPIKAHSSLPLDSSRLGDRAKRAASPCALWTSARR